MMNDCVSAARDCQMGCIVGRQAQVVAPADDNDCWHLPMAAQFLDDDDNLLDVCQSLIPSNQTCWVAHTHLGSDHDHSLLHTYLAFNLADIVISLLLSPRPHLSTTLTQLLPR